MGKSLSHRMAENVAIGSRWTNAAGVARVMTKADGYIMLRRPGSIPFVLAAIDLVTDWTMLPEEPR